MDDELRPLNAPVAADDTRVDDLFAGVVPEGLRPGRSKLVLAMLLVALPLNIAGLALCTLVPGTLLTLWAWSIAKRELAILEHGELPVAESQRIARLDRFARWMLMGCGALLVAQAYLLTTGFYQALLLRLDMWLVGR